MVFAIMLTTNLASRKIVQINRNAASAAIGCIAFATGIFMLVRASVEDNLLNVTVQTLPAENILTLGKMLMTEFMLPFEVVSVLLLAALIGAIVLARRESS